MNQPTLSSATTPEFLTASRRLTPSLGRGVTAIVAVVLFGLIVSRTSAMTHADAAISTALNGAHVGLIGWASSTAYSVFGPAPAIVITTAIAAAIWLVSRDLRQGITFGIVVAGTWLPSAVVKVVVDRTRPDSALLPHPFTPQPLDASYPSGHVVFITALVMALFLVMRGHPIRPLVVILGGLLVTALALAVVIDGVHYPSDAVASIVWSTGLAPLILEIWNRVVISRLVRAKRAQKPTA